MNCASCGSPVSPDAAFCAVCGQKIEAEPQPTDKADAEMVQALNNDIPISPCETAADDVEREPVSAAKKSGKVRMLVALLCAVVFVGVCVWGAAHFSKAKDVNRSDSAGTSEDANETETETVSEALTGNSEPVYSDDEYYWVLRANEFLTSLVDKDLETTLDLICVRPDEPGDPLKAYSFLKSVDVTSYEFVESQPSEGVFLVRLNISKSGSELFPVGTSLWNLEVSQIDDYVTLFKPADKSINLFYADDEFPRESEAAYFCMNFAVYIRSFLTTDNFNTIVPDTSDTDVFTDFCYSLAIIFNLGINEVKREDLERNAENVLGITEIDFTKCAEYQADGDILSFDGHGGQWLDCSLSSEQYDPLSRQHTVVIDYYSDSAYILKAKTVQYVVKENYDGSFRLLSTKLLYDTGLKVSGGMV